MTTYTMEQLSEATGLSGRTIRYYISERLIPGPTSSGRGALYTDAHLNRLKSIIQLVNQGVLLSQIRERLDTVFPERVVTTAAPTVLAPDSGWDVYRVSVDAFVIVRQGSRQKDQILKSLGLTPKGILLDVNKEDL